LLLRNIHSGYGDDDIPRDADHDIPRDADHDIPRDADHDIPKSEADIQSNMDER